MTAWARSPVSRPRTRSPPASGSLVAVGTCLPRSSVGAGPDVTKFVLRFRGEGSIGVVAEMPAAARSDQAMAAPTGDVTLGDPRLPLLAQTLVSTSVTSSSRPLAVGVVPATSNHSEPFSEGRGGERTHVMANNSSSGGGMTGGSWSFVTTHFEARHLLGWSEAISGASAGLSVADRQSRNPHIDDGRMRRLEVPKPVHRLSTRNGSLGR